jgi:uncharacterized ferritin-like protein (DUF455 family)
MAATRHLRGASILPSIQSVALNAFEIAAGARITGNSVELFRDWMRVSAFAAISPPGF